MRVDETTKDVITTWPLTTVKGWAAAPSSFTLDFGDCQDSFYSVQTSEGETISEVIDGYINNLKRQGSEKFVYNADEEATLFEDNIAPQRDTPMQQIDQVTPIVPVPI